MLEMPRTGRPPLPEDQRGKRVNLYLSAEAVEALRVLVGGGNQSELVSRLLVEEQARCAAEKLGIEVPLSGGSKRNKK